MSEITEQTVEQHLVGANHNWESQEAVVGHLLFPDRSSEIVCGSLQLGGFPKPVLWTVRQSGPKRWIECNYILYDERSSRPFGYSRRYESNTPAACNCPLEFLSMTPSENEEWRDRVREWHLARQGHDKVVVADNTLL